jgi:hypothetical protein
MSNMNLTKVSTNLTARERAKLVISYQLKSFQNLKEADFQKYQDGDKDEIQLFGDAEVKQLLAGCPPEQGREYNFYIGLKQHIWQKIVPDIHDQVMRLSVLEGSIANVKQLLHTAPFIQHAIEELERMPVVVSKVEYDEAVNKSREYERTVVLSLEGRYSLVEQEAYALLVTENHINEGGDLDSYLDYMDDFGRTEEEIVNEKVEEVQKGVAKYLKKKERIGSEDPFFKYYSEFVGLNGEQLRAKVKEKYADQFILPSVEEHERWKQTLESERKRLLGAVQKGELKAKGDGVEAGSYYDWPHRHQKFAGEANSTHEYWNPLHEECMEIGISDGEVISSSQAKTEDWRQIVVATLHNENTLGFGSTESGERRRESVAYLLKHLAVCELEEKNFGSEQRIIKLTKAEYKDSLKLFSQKAQECLQEIAEDIALIKAVEEKYFDGMDIVNGGGEVDYFSVDYFAKQANTIAESHNRDMKEVENSFTRMSLGFWEYKLEGIKSFMVNTEVSVKEEVLAKKLRNLERDVER